MLIKCKECGKEFETSSRKQYCSVSCRNRYWYKHHRRVQEVEHVCPVCGNTFNGYKFRVFCSDKCRQDNIRQKRKEDMEVYKPEEQRHRESTIDAVNKIARANGMSYGQYRAMQWTSENKYKIT